MKIRPVGAKFFHADRQMERNMVKLIVAFHNFVNTPTKVFFLTIIENQPSYNILYLVG